MNIPQYSSREVQIIEAMQQYTTYRGLDAVFGTSASKPAYDMMMDAGLESVFVIAQKVLGDLDVDRRCCAAEMLMRLDAHRGLPLILPLLREDHPGVRSFVCGIIHDFGDMRAAGDVLRVLMNDEDGTVRHHAAFALGAIGGEDMLPHLRAIAERETGTDWEGRPVREQIADTIDAISCRLAQS